MNKIPFAEFNHLVVSHPPRWGMTTQIFEYIKTLPAEKNVAYVTHSRTVAEMLVKNAGPFVAQVFPLGISPGVPHGFYDYVVIDNPYKNAMEAQNASIRNIVSEYTSHLIFCRLQPTGQAIVAGTPACKEDIFGELESLTLWVSMKLA